MGARAAAGAGAGLLPALLDDLCRRGEVVWSGAGGELRRARVRFLFRGQGNVVLPPASTEDLGPDGQRAYEFLKAEGASFAGDLQAGLGWGEERAVAALGELAVAGLATCDELAALRRLAGETAGGGGGAIESSLAADLAARRSASGPPRVGSAEARRRFHQLRTAGKIHRFSPDRPPEWPGRWSLVHRSGVLGPALPAEETIERQAELLLARYGVVTRELVEREEGPWGWTGLYQALVLMEMRGEVRRGYFVAGFSGAQFALPDAVERLRAPDLADRTTVVINALDPAAPWGEPDAGAGTTAPLLRGRRVPSTGYVLAAGQVILLAEDNGSRLSTAGDEEQVAAALEAYFSRPGAARHLAVTKWNGGPIWETPGETLLKGLGFYTSPAGMER